MTASTRRFLEDVSRSGALCYRYDSLISLLSTMQGFGPANTPYRLLPGMLAPASVPDDSTRAQVYCYGNLFTISKRVGDGQWGIDPALSDQAFSPLKEVLGQGVVAAINARG